jgi:hypothetical protein
MTFGFKQTNGVDGDPALDPQLVRAPLVMDARRFFGLGDIESVIDRIEHNLEHNRDDPGAACASRNKLQFPVLENHCRAHGRERALARARHIRLTVQWLPKYAPELNDIKLVWRDLKAHHLAHRTFAGPDDLNAAIHAAVADLILARRSLIWACLRATPDGYGQTDATGGFDYPRRDLDQTQPQGRKLGFRQIARLGMASRTVSVNR